RVHRGDDVGGRVVDGGGQEAEGVLDGGAAIGVVIGEGGSVAESVDLGAHVVGRVVDHRGDVAEGVLDGVVAVEIVVSHRRAPAKRVDRCHDIVVGVVN